MANSPYSTNVPLDFRAPPPSPVAAGRRSSVANDEILTEFLHRSLRVPDLVLPDRVFPRQNSKIQNLPKLDFFKALNISSNFDKAVIDAIAQTGCFELVNHGVSSQLLSSVVESGGGVFQLSNDKKSMVLRSAERSYGFVEFHGDEKKELINEEFVWCRDDSLKLVMEKVWPDQYSNFGDKMEALMSKIENISEVLLKLFLGPFGPKPRFDDDEDEDDDDRTGEKEIVGSLCYLYKHCTDSEIIDDEHMDSLRYDVIRMLIRGSEHSHTLCFHVCDGSSEFHVYSKKGWVSFSPARNALIITIGDQLQTWSKRKYKHVIGRPIFKGDLADYISMAILYSPPPSKPKIQKDNTISFGHQVLFVLILTLLYNLYSYVST